MSKLITHIKRWNKWRKNNMNGKLHKFLVLLGIRKSITLQYVLLDEEVDEIKSDYEKICRREKGSVMNANPLKYYIHL